MPGLSVSPSGIVISPSKTALLHASPSDAVTGAADVGRTGACVAPATGVLTKEKVGRAAASTVGDATPDVFRVGNTSVGTDAWVLVGMAVFVGLASAVWVNCTASWATVVPTSAVLIALTSRVGAG